MYKRVYNAFEISMKLKNNKFLLIKISSFISYIEINGLRVR